MTNKEKSVEIGLHFRDLCLSQGVTRDNAEIISLIAQQLTMLIAAWKDEQIDRMKCCYNCENWRDGLCDHVGGDVMADFVCDEWTMKGGEE